MSARTPESSAVIIGAALRLEAERVIAMTASNRAAIVAVDTVLDGVLERLAEAGVAHPLHAVAAHYGLSGGEYAVLIAALMPFVAPDLEPALADDLRPGDPVGVADAARVMAAAIAVSDAQFGDETAFLSALKATRLVRERLVQIVEVGGAAPVLRVHGAILELLGFDANASCA